ncbi:ParB/RepB/Spo0J family partition protein [Ideonella livida]|uniref:ParB/RepB/Spo0J family partition protein n=1 Tax=Ideonella livida TaxID=2707176 RepID=A0A7C9PKP0_9BURK|nr:ParB/RepB/Spo0J family partition protein [Ideonella livida]NDY93534.1 ParB/RepB/Spo0J family partition protein [Ideonella livida]
MSKLIDKAKGINFDEDDEAAAAPAAPSAAAPRASVVAAPRTAVGAISASLAMGRGVEAENRALKEKLKAFEDAAVVEFLDPKRIQPSRYANRHEASFQGAEFDSLKAEIASAGRNVQPIKVRRILGSTPGDAAQYEIAFGHRRHRACLELGIPVAAVVQSMTDAELFAEMDRENRERANLSPWEQGVMYKRALDTGLFPSLRKLAAALGVQVGNASTAIQLANLPAEVVAAFGSPLELQYRWAPKLQTALETDAAGVLQRAKALSRRTTRPVAKEVLQNLLGLAPVADAGGRSDILRAGQVVGSMERDDRGGLLLRLKPGTLGAAEESQLSAFVAQLVDGQLRTRR